MIESINPLHYLHNLLGNSTPILHAPASKKFGVDQMKPTAVNPDWFNESAEIPYGLTTKHIENSMIDWTNMLDNLNTMLVATDMPRLETFLMPASFSGMVGEFINTRIPTYCSSIVQNRYHNGHPDLIPTGEFADNAVQHSDIGIEVKSSRYKRGWQGHNKENVWLMVFVFEANSASEDAKSLKTGVDPVAKPFRFTEVLGAQLDEDDWQFSGRSETSRRTPTSSINANGYAKLANNWIYKEVVDVTEVQ